MNVQKCIYKKIKEQNECLEGYKEYIEGLNELIKEQVDD